MKQIGFILGIGIFIFSVFLFVNRLYYPPLDVNNVSAKDAIEKLETSDHKVVEIAAEGDTVWYITRTERQGISIADENIKEMIGSNGWKFKEKDGGGLFFEKGGEHLIVTTQMWGKNYVLVKVQDKFKHL